jgi:hypothetical protein
MRYDGPPGLMLDLVPPSPDGVDLEWIHPYTDAQPYVYARNNPLNATDPSGLDPKMKPQKSPKRPTPCGMFLCCGTVNIGCINPGPLKDSFPCHCFIRVGKWSGPDTPASDFVDYHGWIGPASDRCCDTVAEATLTCPLAADGAKNTALLTQIDCLPLGRTVDCDALKACLDGQVTECRSKILCYGYCDFPNSNTIAYRFASACSTQLKRPKPLPDVVYPKLTKNCPAKAPGWGPYPE